MEEMTSYPIIVQAYGCSDLSHGIVNKCRPTSGPYFLIHIFISSYTVLNLPYISSYNFQEISRKQSYLIACLRGPVGPNPLSSFAIAKEKGISYNV